MDKKEIKQITQTQELVNAVADIQVGNIFEYQPQEAKLLKFEQLQKIIEQINNQNQNLIIQESDLKEYTKRGNVITQLRNLSKKIKQIKTDVHKQARASYANLDKQIDELVSQLEVSTENLSQQVNNFKQQQAQKQIQHVHEVFDDYFEQFKQTYQDLPINNIIKFINWSNLPENGKVTNLSENKLKESIVNYCTSQVENYQKYVQLINSMPETMKKFLSVAFDKAYAESSDAESAFISAQSDFNKFQQMQAEMQQVQTQESQAPQQAQTQVNEPQESQVSQQPQTQAPQSQLQEASKVSVDSVYAFVVAGGANARKVKDFLESEGINYKMQVVE